MTTQSNETIRVGDGEVRSTSAASIERINARSDGFADNRVVEAGIDADTLAFFRDAVRRGGGANDQRIYAELLAQRDDVIIANATTRPDYDYGSSRYKDWNGSILKIDSAPVASAITGAVNSASQGGVSSRELEQLEALRELVARYGVNDGRFDTQEVREIQTAANAIGNGSRANRTTER